MPAAADPPNGLPYVIVGDIYEGSQCFQNVHLVWLDANGWYLGQAGNVFALLDSPNSFNTSMNLFLGDSDNGDWVGVQSNSMAVGTPFLFDQNLEGVGATGAVYRFIPRDLDFGSSWAPYRVFVLFMCGFVGLWIFYFSFAGFGWFFRGLRYSAGQFI